MYSIEVPKLTDKQINLFMEKICSINSGCWIWQGATNDKGYGTATLNSKSYYAHRVSFSHFNSKIPSGLTIDHLCRVRNCVNPKHLRAVTQKENVRCGNVGIHQKSKTHCPQGHPYKGSNLFLYDRTKTIKGKTYKITERQCRICRAENKRRKNNA